MIENEDKKYSLFISLYRIAFYFRGATGLLYSDGGHDDGLLLLLLLLLRRPK